MLYGEFDEKEEVLRYIELIIKNSAFTVKDDKRYEKSLKNIIKLREYILNDELHKVQKKKVKK